jgi:hypothetical protein
MRHLIKIATLVLGIMFAKVATAQSFQDHIKLTNVETRHLMSYLDNGHLYTGVKNRASPDKNIMIKKYNSNKKEMKKRIRRYKKNKRIFYGLK